MKKIITLICFALIFAVISAVAVSAMVDDSAYSVTEDMAPGTNVPDKEVESRSNKESEGALERAYESAKDKAETAGRDAVTEVEKAAEDAKDMDKSSTARTLGIIIAIIAAVAVIAVVIAVSSRKKDETHGRDETKK